MEYFHKSNLQILPPVTRGRIFSATVTGNTPFVYALEDEGVGGGRGSDRSRPFSHAII